MRLTQWTDYSLRVLMYCAQCESRQMGATIQEIADQHDISKSHLTKIVTTLAGAGYLQTTRGRGGGIRLGLPPYEIRIGDVVRETETDFLLVECFDQSSSSCALMPSCRLRSVMSNALNAFYEQLDKITLADLMGGSIVQHNVIKLPAAKFKK